MPSHLTPAQLNALATSFDSLRRHANDLAPPRNAADSIRAEEASERILAAMQAVIDEHLDRTRRDPEGEGDESASIPEAVIQEANRAALLEARMLATPWTPDIRDVRPPFSTEASEGRPILPTMPDNNGPFIPLSFSPGYMSGEAIRRIGEAFFGRMPCYRAMADVARREGIDPLGSVRACGARFAEMSGLAPQMAEAMDALAMHIASQASACDMNDLGSAIYHRAIGMAPPRIGVALSEETTYLVVAEEEPILALSAYAFPGGRAFYEANPEAANELRNMLTGEPLDLSAYEGPDEPFANRQFRGP